MLKLYLSPPPSMDKIRMPRPLTGAWYPSRTSASLTAALRSRSPACSRRSRRGMAFSWKLPHSQTWRGKTQSLHLKKGQIRKSWHIYLDYVQIKSKFLLTRVWNTLESNPCFYYHGFDMNNAAICNCVLTFCPTWEDYQTQQKAVLFIIYMQQLPCSSSQIQRYYPCIKRCCCEPYRIQDQITNIRIDAFDMLISRDFQKITLVLVLSPWLQHHRFPGTAADDSRDLQPCWCRPSHLMPCRDLEPEPGFDCLCSLWQWSRENDRWIFFTIFAFWLWGINCKNTNLPLHFT